MGSWFIPIVQSETMKTKNSVFIATSLDGYIADKNGNLDWLQNTVPNPDGIDMGYGEFTNRIDALVMGRNTFEMICSFDMEWPYKVPVFVMSSTLIEIPKAFKKYANLVKGSLSEILNQIHAKGFYRLYIDGGKTIQSFLIENLIDEIIITKMPVLLGGGVSLFGDLTQPLLFDHVKSEVFLDAVAQDTYNRRLES